MLRVYAKFYILIILFSTFLLSGCGSAYYSSTNTGVMSNDPNSVPNIGWQTPDQRQTLSQQSNAANTQQPNTAEAPANASPVPPVTAEEVPAVPRQKVIVSILLPLSGPKSALGQSMLKAAQMALFDIGSANFTLVPRDTKSTPAGAVAAAQAALNAHSALILGPIFAEDLKAIKPVVNPTHTPIVSFTTDWTLAGDNTYVMGFLPFTQVMRVVKYAQEHGHSRIAVFAPQTEYADVVVSTLQKSGVSIAHINRYPAKQLDLTAAAQDLAKDKSGDAFDFDALMLPLGSEGLRALVTTLNSNGINQRSVKFIGTGLWDDPSLMTNAALSGGWFSAPDPNLRVDFEKRYMQNYGSIPLRLSSLAYDATALASVLARSATDPASTYSTEAITNPRGFAGIDGIFRFRSDGLSERGLAVLEIHGGGAKVIDPAPTAFISSGT